MRFRLVEKEAAQHSVSLLCTTLGVTRAGYYAWRRRGPSRRAREDERLKALIGQIFTDSHKTYGAPRIQAELADAHGIGVGKKRVARLMCELGIQGVSRRERRRYRTTIPAADAAAVPDLVKRQFRASGPDRLWVADIKYLQTREGYLFLACVLDVFSRRVVGWSMRDDLKTELVLDALGMALARRAPRAGLVHHSDRGSQYTSLAFGKTLRDAEILSSMGRRGDALDNALCESFFATLETELLDRVSFTSREQARIAVFRYIDGFYNPRRRHSALGNVSPERYEERMKRDRLGTAVAV